MIGKSLLIPITWLFTAICGHCIHSAFGRSGNDQLLHAGQPTP